MILTNMTDPTPNTEAWREETVEAMARLIDPSSWRVFDGYLAEVKRKYKGKNAGYDPAAFKDKKSIALAERLLALLATRGWTARDRAASEEIGRLRLRIEQLERTSLSGAWVIAGPDMRWAKVQRLRFIGHLIEAAGCFNRADLMKKFNISQPQASSDIGEFKRWNPEIITYDSTAKRYIARRALQAGEPS